METLEWLKWLMYEISISWQNPLAFVTNISAFFVLSLP